MRRDWPAWARVSPTVYADMRKFVPLQAADLVAYELQKEYGRRLSQPEKEPRYGYKALVRMSNAHKPLSGRVLFRFLTRELMANLSGQIDSLYGESEERKGA
jgi:hypothetical protein